MSFFGQRQRGLDLRRDYSKAAGGAVADTRQEPAMRGLDVPGFEQQRRDFQLDAPVRHTVLGQQLRREQEQSNRADQQLRLQEDANIRAWAQLALQRDEFALGMRRAGMDWLPGGAAPQTGGVPAGGGLNPALGPLPETGGQGGPAGMQAPAQPRYGIARSGDRENVVDLQGRGRRRGMAPAQPVAGPAERPQDMFGMMQEQQLRGMRLQNEATETGTAIAREKWTYDAYQQNRAMGQEDEDRRLKLFAANTPESVRRYEQTRDPGVLEARPEPLDKSLVKSIFDNPEKWTEGSRDRFAETGNLADLDFQAKAEDLKEDDMPFFVSVAGEMGYHVAGVSEEYTKGEKKGKSFATPKGQAYLGAVKTLKKAHPDWTSSQIAAGAAKQLGYRNLADPDVGAVLDQDIQRATKGRNKPETKELQADKKAWGAMQGRLRAAMAGYGYTPLGSDRMQAEGKSLQPHELLGKTMAAAGMTLQEAMAALTAAGVIGQVGLAR